MITISNLNNKWDEIKGRLNPETVKMGVENGFLESAQEYEELKDFFDDEAKELLNKFIARVNRELKSDDGASEKTTKSKKGKEVKSLSKEDIVKKIEYFNSHPLKVANFFDRWEDTKQYCDSDVVRNIEKHYLNDIGEYAKSIKNSYIIDAGPDEMWSRFVREVQDDVLDNLKNRLKSYDEKSDDKPTKSEPKASQKSEKNTKSVPKSAKSEPKKPKVKKEPVEVNYVDAVPADVAILKRAASLHGKKATQKVMAQALSLLKALQRNIEEKKISKTSQYADEIVSLQDSLIRLLQDKRVNHNTTIEMKSIELMKKLKKEVVVSDYVKLAKKFIALQEKDGVAVADAVKLSDKMKDFVKVAGNTKEAELLKDACQSLERFAEGKTEKIEIAARSLRGLYGLMGTAGLAGIEEQEGEINSLSILNAKFDVLEFTGKWADFFGKPSKNFRFMVYGKPGNGKSTFSLRLAGYLSKQLDKRVLYVAGEEKFGYTLQEKLERLNVANANLYIATECPKDFSGYDVIFIDSVNTLGLEAEELQAMPKNKAYCFVFQSTKDGNYRGTQEFAHDADVVVKVENMVAVTEKNRFGGSNLQFNV